MASIKKIVECYVDKYSDSDVDGNLFIFSVIRNYEKEPLTKEIIYRLENKIISCGKDDNEIYDALLKNRKINLELVKKDNNLHKFLSSYCNEKNNN